MRQGFMARFGLCLTLMLGLASSSVAAQVRDPNARARGRVLDAATNAPIAGARVVFAFRGRTRLEATTDETGRYAFAELEPGPYRLTVQKAGYAAPDPATLPAFWLLAGQTLDVATVSLQRTGAIAGRILDPAGEPLVDINVRAVRPGGAPDPRASVSRTNDLGEFRVFGLMPGDYVIAASPQPFGLDALPASTALVPSTFFPGTADPASAQVLAVSGGQTVAGIEFRVVTAPTFKVSGVIVDELGAPVPGAQVTLVADVRATGGASGRIGDARSDAAGRFVIDNVASGPYYATAIVMTNSAGIDSASPQGGAGGVPGSAAGSMPVQVIVADANVEGVSIVIERRH
jgi:hypothetical protein